MTVLALDDVDAGVKEDKHRSRVARRRVCAEREREREAGVAVRVRVADASS